MAAFGRSYRVELDSGATLVCFPRGKRSEIACGDRVRVAYAGEGQGVIETFEARLSLFYRSDAHRQKLIAANVTQVIVVLAASPSYYEDLLNRCLVAVEHARIRAVIVLNKLDLDTSGGALESLRLYEQLGYPLVPLAAKLDVAPLAPWLAQQTSVLVGQSGMGKSTIINRLLPEANAATAEMSIALDSGRHTTTHARLYHLDGSSNIIDAPGMQEFGLHHLSPEDLDHAFVEFRPLLGQCRFGNCRHASEPGCALVAGVASGAVSARRLASYRRILAELKR
ncbi:MAG: ribosome small subunit-dependent GTPase A [Betaproteobacteria bacterium]